MSNDNLPAERVGTIMTRLESLQLTIQPLLDDVPDSNADDDAYIRIMEQLAGAETLADLQAPWDSNGLAKYIDQSLWVNDIRKSPSDKPGGFSHFLLLDCKTRDGELVTLTTSAGAVVVQLLKARALGQIPVLVIPRAKKTKRGFEAQHLEFPLGG